MTTRNSASTIHDRDKCERCGSFVQGVSFRHRGGDWLCLSCFDASLRAAEDAARAESWREGAEAMREAVIKRLDEALPELAGWTELTALPIPEPPPSRDGAPQGHAPQGA